MFSYPARVQDWGTRVLQAGTSGDAVVFVHGTGGRADRWRHNLDALARAGFRAYAIDLPGHGFADKGPGFDYSVPGYAAFLGNFLDAMNIGKAAIVGTSLGGHVAALFTCDNAQRVNALVLCGSMGLVPVGEDVRKRVQRGAVNQSYEGLKQKLTRLMFDPALITEDVINEEYSMNNSPGAKESFKLLGDYIRTRLDDDVVAERMSAMTSCPPTLIIWGEEDKSVPLSVGTAAHKLLPASRLVVFPKTAHTPYFEQPDKFNQLVVEFLAASGDPHLKR